MTSPQEQSRVQELGDFLRTRRGRISPEQVGLPRGERRRTPGLRREEVAQLAGVSVDWYTWLEQGRDIRVSEQVLTSLARALQLDSTETDYLFLLAEEHVQTPQIELISPALRHLLNLQGAVPAFILGYCWD